MAKNDIVGKKRLVFLFLNKIKKLRSATEQNEWLKELSRYANIPESVLIREFETLPMTGGEQTRSTGGGQVKEANFAVSVKEKLEKIDIITRRLIVLAFSESSFLERLKSHRDLIPGWYHQVFDNPKDDLALDFEMQSSFEFSDLSQEGLKFEFEDLLRHLEIEGLKR